jgi:endogenous inhibitor of DNA gyrase (YacG/DUF329 family)
MSSNPDANPEFVCPICKRPVVREDSRGGGVGGGMRSYFPFCSERCELIDLGRWLGGRYQIPVEEEDESDRAGDPPR